MKKKNSTTAIILILLFGVFGMLYTSVAVFFCFLAINIVGVFLLYLIELPITPIFFLTMLIIQLNFVYLFITERNKIIDNKLEPMTKKKKMELPSKIVGNVLAYLFFCIFLTCFLYGILLMIYQFKHINYLLEGLVFVLVTNFFYLTFLRNTNLIYADHPEGNVG